MKKILLSFSVIVFVSSLVAGGTTALFSDTEVSEGNTFLTGTIDIDVDDENPWNGGLEIGDIKPGEGRSFEWTVNNVGTYPANIWLTFNELLNLTGLQSEPECEAEDGIWDEVNEVCTNMAVEENDLDEVIDYFLRVEVYGLNAQGKVWDQKIYTENYTLADVKNLDIILGMIPIGGYMKIYQEFDFQYGSGNEYQGDITMFNVKIAAEQLRGTLVLENKSSDWVIRHDGTQAILNHTTKGPEFAYNLIAGGLSSAIDYSLIYYVDPWKSNQSILIGKEKSLSDGSLAMLGSKKIGDNLPIAGDVFFPDGAKIWLVPSSWYDEVNHQMKHWYDKSFLYETAMIVYTETDFGSVVIPDVPTGLPEAPEGNGGGGVIIPPTVPSVILNDLGADPQYGYLHDYSTASVNFSYASPSLNRLSGTVTATGLKPYATYQMKFEGKPSCLYGVAGDDALNNYIGSIGRWWDNDLNINANTPGNCISGYLAWDFVTADAFGTVVKSVETANSYHVLRCSGGTCGVVNDSQLTQPDTSHPSIYFCAPSDVNGELEHGVVIPCDGLNLDAGNYDLRLILSEESFHQSPGTWTAVMDADIQFEIQ